MYRFFTLLFSLVILSSSGFSKTLEIELVSCDILFFDSSEDEMDTNEKIRLSKSEFKIFFFLHIVKELQAIQIPWTSDSGENISNILYKILDTFKYDDYIYFKKYNTEESDDEESDDYEPLEF